MILRFFAVILAIAPCSVFAAENGMLLNCHRYDGEEQFQIYINQADKYVIYNAQTYDNYERMQRFTFINSNEIAIRDIGLDISINNESFIVASGNSASFLLIKKDASFSYAWTTPIQISEGVFAPFGDSHKGSCSINPFNAL